MENIYKELQNLGFSQYECKAYIGLLKNSPITGYEVSKRTGVPRSTIYEVLGKLLDKRAIYTVPSEPVKYSPVPAKELINRLRKTFETSFDYLEKELTSLESERETDVIWRIRGNDHVIEEMLAIINHAKDELWLSIWEPEVPEIKKAIDRKVAEGVNVFTILFGSPKTQLGLTYHHNYMPPDIVQERMGGHLSVAARDGEEVVIANFTETASPWAVKTKDPALVLVAIEYIRHDIMIEEITKELGPDKLDALWRRNQDLIQVVTGKRFESS
ncbi:TrmB family transcriptional regulator [Cytobacillus solani]|uniref:Transcriptional regulator n=1 Tax=Cytobacillus solani TaxID=1637975 RepID=A0A0Q3QU14_9BACI|nr:helix-turn-helix domain-containing protein [Cytobacillus solani]KOP79897.1 transcriptional regulator [Bacillus sp. FJAT-21945]KQL21222.1 transcriptional regulator [Cytobacillus solani]